MCPGIQVCLRNLRCRRADLLDVGTDRPRVAESLCLAQKPFDSLSFELCQVFPFAPGSFLGLLSASLNHRSPPLHPPGVAGYSLLPMCLLPV